ncbi:MAG TPA: hypothetical protein VE172_05080, partial [Stackebrandtia sp.]|nr:hypothetical protein [Stackebrandtia sp.]
VIGGRPGGPAPYGTPPTRPVTGTPLEPAPLARPVIGLRPGVSGPGGVPTIPNTPARGVNRPLIGKRTVADPAAPVEGTGGPRSTTARSTVRPKAMIDGEAPAEAVPSRSWTRSPVRLRTVEPEPTLVEPEPEPLVGKPPGQRVSIRPVGEETVAERAVFRGTASVPNAPSGPGQDVFAKAARDRAKAEAEAASHVTDGDVDYEWRITQDTVRGVITGPDTRG